MEKRIKLESYFLENMEIKEFRNLYSENLSFARRINVISGQNGVGKSTILALICSAVGLKKKINDIDYSPKFHKYLYVSPAEAESQKYNVITNFRHENSDVIIRKKLRLKNNKKTDKRVQIIPDLEVTNKDLKDSECKTKKELKEKIVKNYDVGFSAKLEMPAIYCSTSRVYPLSEIDDVRNPTNETEISKIREDNKLYTTDIVDFYKDNYNKVLQGSISNESKLYHYSKMSIANNELSMEINETEPLSKSVGQNALGTIVACLTKFKLLQLTCPDEYKGGIFCIDEADISLHPEAQLKLLNMLYDVSEELNLQIFLTTHSFTLLEEVERKASKRSKDYSINYFYDRYNPRLKVNPGIDVIKSDLLSISKDTEVKVYFEDDMSFKIHQLLEKAANSIDGLEVNPKEIRYKAIVTNGGKDFLQGMIKKDSYFTLPLIILDGDAKLNEDGERLVNVQNYLENNIPKGISDKQLAINCMTLPTYLAPEGYLYNILYKYTRKNDMKTRKFWEYIEDRVSIDPGISSQFIDSHWLVSKSDVDNQKKGKNDYLKEHVKWEEVLDFFDKTNMLAYYYKENLTELKLYIKKFNGLLERQNKIIQSKKSITNN